MLRIYQLGSALSLLLLGVLFGGGFQTPAEKNGVVDINGLVEASNFGKGVKANLEKMRTAREDILSFLDTNRVLTIEQATQLRDLSLKPDRTPAESATLDALKSAVVATNKKWAELATKNPLTPEDRTLLQDYADRSQKISELGRSWVAVFTNDIDSWIAKQQTESNARAREAISTAAKAAGYTMIYDKSFAPYGANDLTADALTAMNAKP